MGARGKDVTMEDKRRKKRGGGAGGAGRPGVLMLLGIAVAALVLGGLLDRSGLAKLNGAAPAALRDLRISEVQNHNVLTLLEADGTAPAWVELENTGGEAVSLHGVCLARDARINKTFVCPDITLQGGECLLIYADGKGIADADGTLHAGFRLPSAGGTTLYLFDAAQHLLDSVEVTFTQADESIVRGVDGAWTTTANPTPGEPNGAALERGMTVQDGDVELTELVSSNIGLFPDENGEYSDYIEVHNRTSGSVSLAGYWLSDNAARPNKWQLDRKSVV